MLLVILSKEKPSVKNSLRVQSPDDCDDYDFGLVGTPAETKKFATEHILQFQLLESFLEAKSGNDGLVFKES